MHCQIEFVSSDSDNGMPCGKPAVTKCAVYAGDGHITVSKTVAELFEIANVRTFFPETDIRSSRD
jgi:hypothetical protein